MQEVWGLRHKLEFPCFPALQSMSLEYIVGFDRAKPYSYCNRRAIPVIRHDNRHAFCMQIWFNNAFLYLGNEEGKRELVFNVSEIHEKVSSSNDFECPH